MAPAGARLARIHWRGHPGGRSLLRPTAQHGSDRTPGSHDYRMGALQPGSPAPSGTATRLRRNAAGRPGAQLARGETRRTGATRVRR